MYPRSMDTGAPRTRCCVGCGGQVPDTCGPTHPYMTASPGCWQRYGEIIARSNNVQHVDCFAVQHPGGAERDRRQRQSVAVHLTALCLVIEHEVPAERVQMMRGTMSRTVLPRVGLADWPYLPPPTSQGGITVANVYDAADAAAIREWAQSAWSAWFAHHGVVRQWAVAVGK